MHTPRALVSVLLICSQTLHPALLDCAHAAGLSAWTQRPVSGATPSVSVSGFTRPAAASSGSGKPLMNVSSVAQPSPAVSSSTAPAVSTPKNPVSGVTAVLSSSIPATNPNAAAVVFQLKTPQTWTGQLERASMWLNLRDTGALPDDNRLWACAAAVSQENMNKWKEYTGKDSLPSGVERYVVEHEGKEYDLTGLVYVPVDRGKEDQVFICIERKKNTSVTTAVDSQQLCDLLGLKIDRDPQSDRIVTPDFVLSARITDGWIPLEVLMVSGQTPALGQAFSSLTAKAGNAQLLASGAGRWEYNGTGVLTWNSLGMMNREARVSDKQEQFLMDAGNAWYRDNIMVPELRQEVLLGFNTEGQPVNREAALQELRDALAVPNPDGTSSAWNSHPEWFFQFDPIVNGSALPSKNYRLDQSKVRWDLLGGQVRGSLPDVSPVVPFQVGGTLASGQTIKAAQQNSEDGTWSVETTGGNKYRLPADYYINGTPSVFADELGLKITGQTSQGRIYQDKNGNTFFKEGDGSCYGIGPQGWTADNAAAKEKDRQQSGQQKPETPEGTVLLSDYQQNIADHKKDDARLNEYLNSYGSFDQTTQRWVINKPGFSQQSLQAFTGPEGTLGKEEKLIKQQQEQGIYDPAAKTVTKHISNTHETAVDDEKSQSMKRVRVVDEQDVVYQYDDKGNVRIARRIINDGSTERSYSYDDKGARRLEAETIYEDEQITGYTYDARGDKKLYSVATGKHVNGTFVTDFRAVYSYDEKGKQFCTRYWYKDGKPVRIGYANGDREEIVRYSGENDYVSEKYLFNKDTSVYDKQVITVKPDGSSSTSAFTYDRESKKYVFAGSFTYKADGSEILLGADSQGNPAIRGVIALPVGEGISCTQKSDGSVEVRKGESAILIRKDKDGKLVFDTAQVEHFADFTGSGEDYQQTISPATLTIRGDNLDLTAAKDQPAGIFDFIVKPIERGLQANLVNINADPYLTRRNVVLSGQGVGETVSYEKTGLSRQDAAVKTALGVYDIPIISSWIPSLTTLIEANPYGIPVTPGKLMALTGDAPVEQKMSYALLPNNVSYAQRLGVWKDYAYGQNTAQGLPADEAVLNNMHDGIGPAKTIPAGTTVFLPRKYTAGDAISDGITYGSIILGGEGLAAQAVTSPVKAWQAVHPLVRSYIVGATTYLASDEASSLLTRGQFLSPDEAGASLRSGGVTGAVTYGALQGAGTALSYTSAGKNVLAGGAFSSNAWVHKAGTALIRGAQAGGEPFAATWKNVWKFGAIGPAFSAANAGIDLAGQVAGNALSGKNKPLRLSWTGKDQGMGFFQGMALDTASFFKTGVYLPQTLGVFTMPLEATAEGSFARAVGSEHSVSNLGRSLAAKLTNPKELAAITERNAAKSGGQSSLLGRGLEVLDNAFFVAGTISSTENISEFALKKAGLNTEDAQAIAGKIGFASLLFVPSGRIGAEISPNPKASSGDSAQGKAAPNGIETPSNLIAKATKSGTTIITESIGVEAGKSTSKSSMHASSLQSLGVVDRKRADAEDKSGRKIVFGQEGGRVTDFAPHDLWHFTYGGGWKLALQVKPEHIADVDRWLFNNHKGAYKLWSGGDPGEKDFTIYIGPRDAANALAARIESEISGWLVDSVKKPYDDKFFTAHVFGRFDIQKRYGNKDSMPNKTFDIHNSEYGVEGIPASHDLHEWFVQRGGKSRNIAKEEWFALKKEFLQRLQTEMEPRIIKCYGTYYTGTSRARLNADGLSGTDAYGDTITFGEPGYRVTDKEKRSAYREDGGWKLHAVVSPDKYDIVDKWLFKNHRGLYKLLRGGEPGEKDFTVYIGSRDEAQAFAERMEQELGSYLNIPAETPGGDIFFTEKVAGRFDIQHTDYGKRTDLIRYGSEGIPADTAQVFNKVSVINDKAALASCMKQQQQENVFKLILRYGERFTGTDTSWLSRLEFNDNFFTRGFLYDLTRADSVLRKLNLSGKQIADLADLLNAASYGTHEQVLDGFLRDNGITDEVLLQRVKGLVPLSMGGLTDGQLISAQEILMESGVSVDNTKKILGKIDAMILDAKKVITDPQADDALKGNAEKLAAMYPRLPLLAKEFASFYRKTSEAHGRDPGEIRVYMVGGRVKGTPMKADSDIDLIVYATRPIISDGTDELSSLFRTFHKERLSWERSHQAFVLHFLGSGKHSSTPPIIISKNMDAVLLAIDKSED